MNIQVILLSLLLMGSVQGAIEESLHFSSILDHVLFTENEETLVVCDMDNTLLKSSQYVGSVAWSEDVQMRLEKEGIKGIEGKKIENLLWQSVQPYIAVELVDPQIPVVLQSLQSQKIKVVGLTNRSPDEADYSLAQLHSLHIDLSGSFHGKERESYFLEAPVLFQEGILFGTPINKKSQVLITFLEKNSLHPKKVIFIDDRIHHVKDVVQELEKRHISCLGIWFTRVAKE